jgi:hypothetical protein
MRPNTIEPILTNMEPENFMAVAQMLRKEAARSDLPPEQVTKAIDLAEYFEKIATNPCAEIPIAKRFG